MPEEKPIDLDIYKLAVEMADRTSARRSGTNGFFLTLNTALAAVVGIVSTARRGSGGHLPSFDSFGLTLTGAAGIVLSVAWFFIIGMYRRLNWAKFEVITKMEESLPIQMYAEEWRLLKRTEGTMDKARWYMELSLIEQVVPLVFVAIYVSLIIRVWR